MNFDIKNYPGNYAMHCKTEEEARDFLKYLDSIGKKWCNGSSYINDINYSQYHENTAYAFNHGQYARTSWYEDHGYKILEWSNFMERTPPKTKITQAQLKTGDIILHKNGHVSVFIREFEVFLNASGLKSDLCHLGDFTNDLEAIWCDDGNTVVAIRRPMTSTSCDFGAFEDDLGVLIYERERK